MGDIKKLKLNNNGKYKIFDGKNLYGDSIPCKKASVKYNEIKMYKENLKFRNNIISAGICPDCGDELEFYFNDYEVEGWTTTTYHKVNACKKCGVVRSIRKL